MVPGLRATGTPSLRAPAAGKAGMRQSDHVLHSAASKPGSSIAGGAGCNSHTWGAQGVVSRLTREAVATLWTWKTLRSHNLLFLLVLDSNF